MILSLNKASAQTWLWANAAVGTGYDAASSISTDASGNAYITGYFHSPSITFGSTTLTNTGLTDVFLAKYDVAGNLLWAKSAAGVDYDRGNRVYVDAAGNIYMTGDFASPTLTFGATVLTKTGMGYEIFVVKYNAAGNVLWAKSAGGNSYDFSTGIYGDSAGNVYITGTFASPSLTFQTTTLTNEDATGNTFDAFIAKYSAAGTVLWAKSAGGKSSDAGKSVVTDASGNVFLTGHFGSTNITFGATTFTNANSSGTTNDIFLVKYDAAGTQLWAISAGGNANEVSECVSSDPNGNVYICGAFNSQSFTVGVTTLTNTTESYYNDVFILKYDSQGSVLWAKSAGGNCWDGGNSVSTDALGNVYMTGSFHSDSISFGTTTFINADDKCTTDIFLTKYDLAGNVLWVKSMGGDSWDDAVGVSNAAGDKLYMAGYYRSSQINFGTTALNVTGIYSVFIAMLHENTTEIGERHNKKRVLVFPNPLRTRVVLQTDIPLNNATLSIINCSGQEVKQMANLSGHEIVVSRGDLPTGVYCLRLTDTNNLGTKFYIVVEKLAVCDE